MRRGAALIDHVSRRVSGVHFEFNLIMHLVKRDDTRFAPRSRATSGPIPQRVSQAAVGEVRGALNSCPQNLPPIP